MLDAYVNNEDIHSKAQCNSIFVVISDYSQFKLETTIQSTILQKHQPSILWFPSVVVSL